MEIKNVRTLGLKINNMDYAALAKRSSKTERQGKPTDVVQKDGTVKAVNKFKRKKRFGRSMNRRSPSRFLSELKRKAESFGITPSSLRK